MAELEAFKNKYDSVQAEKERASKESTSVKALVSRLNKESTQLKAQLESTKVSLAKTTMERNALTKKSSAADRLKRTPSTEAELAEERYGAGYCKG